MTGTRAEWFAPIVADGWRYLVLDDDDPAGPAYLPPGSVVLRVEPWGDAPYVCVVALSVLGRVWRGTTPACRLGAPGRARRETVIRGPR